MFTFWVYIPLVSWMIISRAGASDPDVIVTGINVTSIPNDLPSDIIVLWLADTGVVTLNLTELSPYASLQEFTIKTSPLLSEYVTAPLNDTPYLIALNIKDGYFPAPPDIGPVKQQIQYFSLAKCGILSIPSDYFVGFTSLRSVSVLGNEMLTIDGDFFTDIGAGLKRLHISEINIGGLPPLEDWTPKLEQLYAGYIGASAIPVSLLTGLPRLAILNVKGNPISTLPDESYFLQGRANRWADWGILELRETELICDQRLCWLKELTQLPSGGRPAVHLDDFPCHGPEELIHIAWDSLTTAQMECPEPESSDMYIRTTMSSRAALFSRAPRLTEDVFTNPFSTSVEDCAVLCDNEEHCIGFVYSSGNVCALAIP